MKIELKINGKMHSHDVEPRTLLVEYLREYPRLTGTHVGCDTTQCGCCAVHLDGNPVKSCTVLAAQAVGREVTTIEGLASDNSFHPMQQAFIDCHALQCGFCTTGMIMTCVAIARDRPDLSDTEVRKLLKGNICRCTGYNGIVSACLAGAKAMDKADV